MIVTVGKNLSEITEFYLYIDDKKLKFPTFLSCLDTCFKVFHVLNLEYSKYSYGVWLFIQLYFYDIKTKYDKNISNVSGLISYLKNIE